MGTTALKELKRFKLRLGKNIPIEKMYLFGSRTTGKIHPFSDYDLIIVSPKFRRIHSRYRSLGFYRYWPLKAPFDFLCYTPEEFERQRKKPTLVAEALKQAIEI